jgi:hypothetical protein
MKFSIGDVLCLRLKIIMNSFRRRNFARGEMPDLWHQQDVHLYTQMDLAFIRAAHFGLRASELGSF